MVLTVQVKYSEERKELLMKEYVMRDVMQTINLYLPYAVLTGISVMIGFYLLQKIVGKAKYRLSSKNNRIRFFLFYLFYVYCYLVIAITYLSRELGSRKGVSLKIFGTYSASPQSQAYMVENVLMFIPFGILLPLLWKPFRLTTWCLCAGLLGSLTIEISQYLSQRGYFQVDDIILNVLGTMIGYVLISCLKAVRGKYNI